MMSPLNWNEDTMYLTAGVGDSANFFVAKKTTLNIAHVTKKYAPIQRGDVNLKANIFSKVCPSPMQSKRNISVGAIVYPIISIDVVSFVSCQPISHWPVRAMVWQKFKSKLPSCGNDFFGSFHVSMGSTLRQYKRKQNKINIKKTMKGNPALLSKDLQTKQSPFKRW